MARRHGVLACEDPSTGREHEPAAAPDRVGAAKRPALSESFHTTHESSRESFPRRVVGAARRQTRGVGWGRILLASLVALLLVNQVSAGFSLPFQERGRGAMRVAEVARAEPAGQGGGLRGIDKVAHMGGYNIPSEMRGLYAAAAGGFAGSSVSFLLHPLDTLKTMSQADKSQSFVQLGVKAVRKNGVYHGLYAGARTAALGSFFSSALYFGTYEASKERLGRVLPPQWQGVCPSLAAVCGNAVSSLIFVPKEVLKQRCQVGELAVGDKALRLMTKIVRTEGVGAMYNGYFATLIRNAPGSMIKFGIFEQMKQAVQKTLDRPLKPEELLATGLTAGCISAIVTTPLDVVKTRIMLGRSASSSPFHVMYTIATEEGVRVLWSGLVPRLLWSATFFAIGISSYEIALNRVLEFNYGPGSAAHLAGTGKQEPTRVGGGVIQGVKHVQEAVTSLPDRLHQIVPRLLQTN